MFYPYLTCSWETLLFALCLLKGTKFIRLLFEDFFQVKTLHYLVQLSIKSYCTLTLSICGNFPLFKVRYAMVSLRKLFCLIFCHLTLLIIVTLIRHSPFKDLKNLKMSFVAISNDQLLTWNVKGNCWKTKSWLGN